MQYTNGLQIGLMVYNYLLLVTSCVCYNLDLILKIPKLKLRSIGYLSYLFVRQTVGLAAQKQCVFPQIIKFSNFF